MKSGKPYILTPIYKKISTCEYYAVNLYRNGIMDTCSIHRLVALAFIPNPDNLPMVNHKDECGLHNEASNLMWATAKENTNWGTCLERRAKTRGTPIYCPELDTYYDSTADAGRKLNINKSLISAVVRGEHQTTHGYHFVKADLVV